MAREGSKTARAIAVMNANAHLPMEEVLPLIAEATGHDIPHARNYYVWCVRKGVAQGIVPVKARKERAPKAAKAPKAKAVKAPKAAKTVKAAAPKAVKPTAPTKSPEEIERIRAANLARLKEVSARMGKRKVIDTEAEVETEEKQELDSFSTPAFLTKRDVELLV